MPSFLRGLGPRPPLALVGDREPFVCAAAAAAAELLPPAFGESEALIRLGSMVPPLLGDRVLIGVRRRGVVGRTLFAFVCWSTAEDVIRGWRDRPVPGVVALAA